MSALQRATGIGSDHAADARRLHSALSATPEAPMRDGYEVGMIGSPLHLCLSPRQAAARSPPFVPARSGPLFACGLADFEVGTPRYSSARSCSKALDKLPIGGGSAGRGDIAQLSR
jgi:hypothetical protein